jgi:hypothetical protein
MSLKMLKFLLSCAKADWYRQARDDRKGFTPPAGYTLLFR